MNILRRTATLLAFFAGLVPLTTPAWAQQNLDVLKERCDAYGFVRGTPEHADCVRKIDAQQAQSRCQALVERGHQVCSKEFADIVGGAAAAMQCGQVQDAYQQYCQ
ncbi:hypothetical protein C5615_29835 [Burkholderia cepacia]|uniref:Uncharacterized protein n=1 Tax=Burkholderia cepacia TaxID=292 RepID=A0A2S8IEH7_BURCE|nr:hypothetical protein C5615_29835 [Burkholderia cepacia]